jgi:antitoxin (DNA-binding transcriptional repressor) of toxin-antitoxin stability system
MTQIAKSEFKARALEYFRQIEATGESIVITDHGVPKLEVRRYQPNGDDSLKLLRGSVLRFDNPTEPVGDDDWHAAN